jgi:phosphoribosyl 1,2-cyclic phosphodiesterase
MLRVTVLGSGSRGNATLIEGRESTVLVDAGFNPRALSRRLAMIGKRPEDISSLILTHEHTDHASGAASCCAKWGWTLHATAGTLEAIPGVVSPTVLLGANQAVTVGGFSVLATPVPHDAREAVALVITDRASGCRLGLATDLGHAPAGLATHFERLDLLIVESNHDERMLADGPYPWMLKRRVGSQLGHLSNRQTAAFIAECTHRGLRAVVLAHLSETNNTPAVAIDSATTALRRAGWRRDDIWAAHQTQVRGPYASNATPGLSVRAVQLGLAL